MTENAKKGVARLTSLFYALNLPGFFDHCYLLAAWLLFEPTRPQSRWGWEGDPSFQLESTHLGTSKLVGSHKPGQVTTALDRSIKGANCLLKIHPGRATGPLLHFLRSAGELLEAARNGSGNDQIR
ncbi:hypothetical protein V2G26_018206 [Clonostachys chloroleuca]